MKANIENNLAGILVVAGVLLFLFEYPQVAIVLAGMALLVLITQ